MHTDHRYPTEFYEFNYHYYFWSSSSPCFPFIPYLLSSEGTCCTSQFVTFLIDWLTFVSFEWKTRWFYNNLMISEWLLSLLRLSGHAKIVDVVHIRIWPLLMLIKLANSLKQIHRELSVIAAAIMTNCYCNQPHCEDGEVNLTKHMNCSKSCL